jgi:hypothetical protein
VRFTDQPSYEREEKNLQVTWDRGDKTGERCRLGIKKGLIVGEFKSSIKGQLSIILSDSVIDRILESDMCIFYKREDIYM